MSTQLELLKPSDEISEVPPTALVIRPNVINLARYKITIAEQRMMAICMTKMNTRGIVERKYRIYQSEYCYYFNIGRSTASQQLRDGLARLGKRDLGWPEVVDGQLSYTEIPLLTKKTKPIRGDGFVELEFHEDVLESLSNLRSEYNWYNLFEFGALGKVHSWRMAELVAQFRNFRFIELKVVELRERWGLVDEYPKFRDFNKYILKPAIEECNDKTNFELELEQIKNGREVIAVKIHIKVKKGTLQAPWYIESKPEEKEVKVIEDFASWGYSSRGQFLEAKNTVRIIGAAWPITKHDYDGLVETKGLPALSS